MRLITWNTQGGAGANAAKRDAIVNLINQYNEEVIFFVQEGGDGENWLAFPANIYVVNGSPVGAFNNRCITHIISNVAIQPVRIQTPAGNGLPIQGGEAGRTAAAAFYNNRLYVSIHNIANGTSTQIKTLVLALARANIYLGNNQLPAIVRQVVIGGDFNSNVGNIERVLVELVADRAAVAVVSDMYVPNEGTHNARLQPPLGGRNVLDYFVIIDRQNDGLPPRNNWPATIIPIIGGQQIGAPQFLSDHCPVTMQLPNLL